MNRQLMGEIPFNPDVPIKRPDSPIPDIEDEREPIDEPFLPQDPGDEPETENLYSFHRKHLGERVRVLYRVPSGKKRITGDLRFGFFKITVETEARIYRIKFEDVLRIEGFGDGEKWTWPR